MGFRGEEGGEERKGREGGERRVGAEGRVDVGARKREREGEEDTEWRRQIHPGQKKKKEKKVGYVRAR